MAPGGVREDGRGGVGWMECPPVSASGPADDGARSLAQFFLGRFGVAPSGDPRVLLSRVASAFSAIPYENLTKILKKEAQGSALRALRSPREVLEDHLATGAGGTCFSLTAALIEVLRGLGFEAGPILADRTYGADTHSAVVVALDGRLQLLDPGFLVVDPTPLEGGEVHVATPYNQQIFRPRQGGRVELLTREGEKVTPRLTFKLDARDPAAFQRAWEASFSWEMMTYPLLSRRAGDTHVYLQGTRLQVRTAQGVERVHVPPGELPGRIESLFGVKAGVAARALEVLQRRGELHGSAAGR